MKDKEIPTDALHLLIVICQSSVRQEIMRKAKVDEMAKKSRTMVTAARAVNEAWAAERAAASRMVKMAVMTVRMQASTPSKGKARRFAGPVVGRFKERLSRDESNILCRRSAPRGRDATQISSALEWRAGKERQRI